MKPIALTLLAALLVFAWPSLAREPSPTERTQLSPPASSPSFPGLSQKHSPLDDHGTDASGMRKGVTFSIHDKVTGKDFPLTLRSIPKGTFMMGSPTAEAERDHYEAQTHATLSHDYWLEETEFTQGLWMALMGTTVAQQKAKSDAYGNVTGVGDSQPMYFVTAQEAEALAAKLNVMFKDQLGNWRFVLPTEAEWEYACRAYTPEEWEPILRGDRAPLPFHLGKVLDGTQANCNGHYPYGTTTMGHYKAGTATVGSYPKAVNAWGLKDMHGNVSEWCADLWDGFTSLPGGTDPLGRTGFIRVLRGGSWCTSAQNCRTALRYDFTPGDRDFLAGFRLATVSVELAEKRALAVTAAPRIPNLDDHGTDASGMRKSVTFTIHDKVTGKDFPLTLRSIPKGTFMMGSPTTEADRKENEAQARTTLSHDYWLEETEFTQGLWMALMGTTVAQQKAKGLSNLGVTGVGDSQPMYFVSAEEADALAAKLNEMFKADLGNWRFVLPTEAEWEYACRAYSPEEWEPILSGDRTMLPFHFGKVLDGTQANCRGDYPKGSYKAGTAAVGSYSESVNAWGLKDMHGNVWEWCADLWDGSSVLPGGTDPLGRSGSLRVMRGGSWDDYAKYCRSAFRYIHYAPGYRGNVVPGFRLATVPVQLGEKRTSYVTADPRIPNLDDHGTDASGHRKGVTFTIHDKATGKDFPLTLRSIPKGTFMMGSPTTEADRREAEAQARTTLSHDYWLEETEFTQGLWMALAGTTVAQQKAKGNSFGNVTGVGDSQPMYFVSAEEADALVAKLNVMFNDQLGNWRFVLPTEAEWEYACRAYTHEEWEPILSGDRAPQPFHFGRVLDGTQANCNGDFAYGTTTKGWNKASTAVVGSYPKAINAWGLKDMHGNVFEWCADSWDDSCVLPGGTDPLGRTGSLRVLRGGAWNLTAKGCRAACRIGLTPGSRGDRVDFAGFRLATVPVELAEKRAPAVTAAPPITAAPPVPPPTAPKVPNLDDHGTDASGMSKGVTFTIHDKASGKDFPLTLRSIPKGTFLMGSPTTEANRSERETQARTTLSHDYWLEETEFTQGLWMALMGTTVAQQKAEGLSYGDLTGVGDSQPMYFVSAQEADALVAKLNDMFIGQLDNWRFVLPTEAEWEYACRAYTPEVWEPILSGNRAPQPFHFGKVLDGTQANCDGNSPYGTTSKGSYKAGTASVGSYGKAVNAWGLKDMHGNVYEWCADSWASSSVLPGGSDPLGRTGSYRVIRGGSWDYGARYCRTAFRFFDPPGHRKTNVGFRLAAVPAELAEKRKK